jgi:hypothetical protein
MCIRRGHGGTIPRDSIEFLTGIPNFSATIAFYRPASHVHVDSAVNKAARLTAFHGNAEYQDDRGGRKVLLRSITINCMSTKDIHNVHKVRLSSWLLRDSGEPLGGVVQSRLKSWSYTGERRLSKSRPTVSEPSYSINSWPGQTN